MKWKANPIGALAAAAMSLSLAACGGGRGYQDHAPQAAAPAPGTVAAQSWTASASDTWRAADGSIRTRRPAPATEPEFVSPAVSASDSRAAGASYAMPDAAAPPQDYAAPPADTLPAPQPDPAASFEGPRGSSQPAAGERRYDEIGYAGIRGVAGGAGAVVAVHRSLAPDTLVEVTSLDTGRTALVLVTGALPADSDRTIDLSAAAAQLLGHTGADRMPVRVRRVAATPQDVAALRSGRAASPRPDAPPVLLSALRKRLPGAAVQTRPPAAAAARPSQRPAPIRSAPARSGRYFVQVAALSNAANAQSLAKSLGGFVKQGGGLHRVQLGPFATQREAETARAGAARAGHGDARVFAVN
jgi:rare lipoprotein A